MMVPAGSSYPMHDRCAAVGHAHGTVRLKAPYATGAGCNLVTIMILLCTALGGGRAESYSFEQSERQF